MNDLNNIPSIALPEPTQSSQITAIKLRLLGAHTPVIVAGAGLAEPSGMQLLRNPAGPEHIPEAAGPVTAERLPELWKFWDVYRRQAHAAKPNEAHGAIADWAQWMRQEGPSNLGVQGLSVITTSPDGIAGRCLRDDIPLVNLHGLAHMGVCTRNSVHRTVLDDSMFPHLGAVPDCPTCGAPMRPDITLMGEKPHKKNRDAAEALIRDADLVVFVGTSGRTSSTLTLYRAARALNADCLLFNDRPWPASLAFVAGAQGNIRDTLPDTFPYPDDQADDDERPDQDGAGGEPA